jgi:FixJ family two-component response regulator
MLPKFRDLPVPWPSAPDDRQPIVYVVDDDDSVREALEELIRSAGLRAETFASGEAFLRHERRHRACCLLLDYALPALNGLEIQQRIAALHPDMSIIFITGHGDVPTTVRAMKAGAVEFMTKPYNTEVLLCAIKSAIQRSDAALRHQERVSAIQTCYLSLTTREREVVELVVRGLLNKQIAAELGISEITIKTHRGRAMRKMRAGSLAGLVKMAAIREQRLPIWRGQCHRFETTDHTNV